jgi:hypothetical protein
MFHTKLLGALISRHTKFHTSGCSVSLIITISQLNTDFAQHHVVQFQAGAGIFFLWHCFQTDSGAHPVSPPVGMGAISPRVKWPVGETDHLHLVLKLRIHGVIPSVSQYIPMAWCLIKHWKQLYDVCEVTYKILLHHF